MFTDTQPCRVCGSPVDLRAQDDDTERPGKDPDGTVDERICSNPGCPSNTADPLEAPRA